MRFFILTGGIFVLKFVVREIIFAVLMYFVYVYVLDCNWLICEYKNVIKIYMIGLYYETKVCRELLWGVSLGGNPIDDVFHWGVPWQLVLFHFGAVILNSTSYSYSRREKWLGGEKTRRSCHKGGSIFIMTVKGINPVCGSLGRASYFIISP